MRKTIVMLTARANVSLASGVATLAMGHFYRSNPIVSDVVVCVPVATLAMGHFYRSKLAQSVVNKVKPGVRPVAGNYPPACHRGLNGL
jgi:hypothetical protein